MASLLGESLEATPTSAYQMAFDLASLGDEGLVTALLPLLPAEDLDALCRALGL